VPKDSAQGPKAFKKHRVELLVLETIPPSPEKKKQELRMSHPARAVENIITNTTSSSD
jgi:hypothetical protein